LSNGFFHGRRLEKWLKNHFLFEPEREGVRFNDLPFNLTITATDALTGNCLILNKENTPELHVHLAVRASISIQGVFREIPIEVQGKPVQCWDGGTTGNCRFDIAHNQSPACLTIASSLTYRGNPVPINGSSIFIWKRPWQIMNHSISILMRQIEELVERNIGNIHIVRPPLGGVGTLDFGIGIEKKKELFRNGSIATAQVIEKLS
jgi:predicted acylesterase/phospholipase RssA